MYKNLSIKTLVAIASPRSSIQNKNFMSQHRIC